MILGARTVAQLEENLKAQAVKLSAEEVAALDEPGRPPITDYPYGVGGTKQRTRPIAGGRA